MSRDLTLFPEDGNGDVLWAMKSHGDSLSAPREVDFSLIFPSEEAALEFCVRCLRSGFKVEMSRSEDRKDSLVWDATVYVHIVPTHEEITRLEEGFGDQAATLGGRNDGWASVFVKSP